MEIGLLGGGGQSREIQAYIRDIGGSVLFKAVDEQYVDSEEFIDILKPTQTQRQTAVVSAVGAPLLRKAMVEKWSGENYAQIVSPSAWIAPDTRLGIGCIIAPRVVATNDVIIGNHTILNPSSTISHDSMLGEYVTVGPGADIAGNVTLGNGVFVGIGATILNGINIAEGVVVGAGAVVIKDIEVENTIVAGNPAKAIAVNDGWLNEV